LCYQYFLNKIDMSSNFENPDLLKVKVCGPDGKIVLMKIKETTAMKELMKDYWVRTKVNPLYARFVFDGVRIGPQDTPKEIGLEDGDQIEVFRELGQEKTAGILNLKVCGPDGRIVHIKIKKTAAMMELMMAYWEKTNFNPLYSTFSCDGVRIDPKNTPNELGIEDGDLITVDIKQNSDCIIELKVKGSDGNIMWLKIKKTAAMKELMNDYWDKTKVNPLYVEFLHDGQSIDPNDTPMELGLVNGDQIEAFIEQKQEQEECLKLKVKGPDEKIVEVEIKKDATDVRELMTVYWEKTKVNPLFVQFHFDGQRIKEKDNLKKLGLKDGDEIEVFSRQNSG